MNHPGLGSVNVNLFWLHVVPMLIIPGLRRKAGFDDQAAPAPNGGTPAAAILAGILVLTTRPGAVG